MSVCVPVMLVLSCGEWDCSAIKWKVIGCPGHLHAVGAANLLELKIRTDEFTSELRCNVRLIYACGPTV